MHRGLTNYALKVEDITYLGEEHLSRIAYFAHRRLRAMLVPLDVHHLILAIDMNDFRKPECTG